MKIMATTTRLLAATAICTIISVPAYGQDIGRVSSDPTPVTNPPGETIEGARTGIYSDGSELNLDNQGTIRGNGNSGGSVFSNGGVVVAGGPAYITNSGTISGQRFGITTVHLVRPDDTLYGLAIGSTVTNSGSIIGDTDDGVRLIGGGTVTNSGYIAGRVGSAADGISMFAFEGQDMSAQSTIGSVFNQAGGVIEGNRFGIILSGGGIIDNAGTIRGTAGAILIQLQNLPGKSGTLLNSGTIEGQVNFNDLGDATLLNSGSISSTTTAAVRSNGPLTVTNSATGSITGATSGIFHEGASLNLENAGTIRGSGNLGGQETPDGGIVLTGGPASITNSGTISGQRFGITTALYLNPVTSLYEPRAIGVAVTNSGSIIGDTDDGIRLIGGGTVTNSGYIAGRVGSGADGVSMFGFTGQDLGGASGVGTVTNLAGGIIQGNRYGVVISSGGAVENAGWIGGLSAGVLIQVNAGGTLGTISNSGTIDRGALLQGSLIGGAPPAGIGISTNSGSIFGVMNFIGLAEAHLNNSGTITGTGGFNSIGTASMVNTGSVQAFSYFINVGTASLTNSGSLGDFVVFSNVVNAALTNSGSITSQMLGGVRTDSAMTLTNRATGSITGVTGGIVSIGTSLSVHNQGTIRGNGSYDGFDAPPDAGITYFGGPATIQNSGLISGQRFGITTAYILNTQTQLLEGRTFGSVIENSGSIIGDTDDGIRLIGGGTVTNSGYIAGRVGASADGISMFAFEPQDQATYVSNVVNQLGGVIEGNRFGIILSNGGTIDNAGTIRGNVGGVGIQTILSGRTGSVTNSGTIIGEVSLHQLAAASLINSGSISNAIGAGVRSTSPLTLTNSATGSITGSTSGVLYQGASLTLSNAGIIRGNGNVGNQTAPDAGIMISNGPASITNSGTISGQRFGITTALYTNPMTGALEGRAIGSIVNNSGAIIGDNDDGIRLIGGGAVTNSGYIAGRAAAGADGISMFVYVGLQDTTGLPIIGTVGNLAGGTIEGARFGIILSGGGAIENAGTINGGSGGAILVQSGGIGTVVNSGTINGNVSFFGLGSAGLDNSGTINGSVFLDTGDDTLILRTGSSVSGTIFGGTGTDQAHLIGSSTQPLAAQQVASLAEFETLLVGQGYWTAASRVGSIGSVTIAPGATLELRQVTIADVVQSALDTDAIVVDGRLIVDFGTDHDFLGSFSGSGDFTKRGDGTFSILGDYAFGGATTIEGGRVRIAGQIAPTTMINLTQGTLDISGTSQTIAQLSGAAGTSVNVEGGALTVNQATDSIYAGTIGGNGTFAKTGSGLLNLTGTSTYAGPTYVQEGTLAVNGSITSPVILTSGATLGGNGTTGTVTVVPGGAVAPGNSIGTLHVAGNVNFAAGSAYRVEANAAGQSDRLIVSGRVTINGGSVEVMAAPGDYRGQTDYSILTAAGGIAGRFSNVVTNLAFLKPQLHYRQDEVRLQLIRNGRPMSAAALTANQASTANALEGLGSNSRLFDLVLGQSELGARTAFSALAGNLYGLLASTLVDRGAIALAEPQAPQPGAVHFWSDVRDEDGRAALALSSGQPAIRHLDLSYGVSVPLGEVRVAIGGGQRAERRLVDDGTQRASLATTYFGMRASYGDTGFAANLGFTYALHSIAALRGVDFPGLFEAAQSDLTARTLNVEGEMSYGFSAAGIRLQPYAGATFTYLSVDRFEEAGRLSSLSSMRQQDMLARSNVGVRASAATTLFGALRIRPRVDVAWQHGWGELSGERRVMFRGAVDPFAVEAPLSARDTLRVDGGLEIDLGRLRLGASYRENIGAAWADRAGRLTAAIRF